MKVAIILPAHNEETLLKPTVLALHAWAERQFGADAYQIVISENGSTDRTRSRAMALSRATPAVSLLSSTYPGKGGALKWGMSAIDADLYILMDVDLSVSLNSVEDMVREMEGADLVIASRRMKGSVVDRPLLRKMITAGYAGLASRMLGLRVRDAQCGCKMISRKTRDEVMPLVQDDGFFFDTELLAKALKHGHVSAEVPVAWSERGKEAGKSKVKIMKTSLEFLDKLLKLRRELRA